MSLVFHVLGRCWFCRGLANHGTSQKHRRPTICGSSKSSEGGGPKDPMSHPQQWPAPTEPHNPKPAPRIAPPPCLGSGSLCGLFGAAEVVSRSRRQKPWFEAKKAPTCGVLGRQLGRSVGHWGCRRWRCSTPTFRPRVEHLQHPEKSEKDPPRQQRCSMDGP